MRFLGVIQVCVLFACWLVGCAKDPFSLRDPEKPTDEGGTYATPIDPLIVADNLRFALIEQNILHYERNYSDLCEFSFDFLIVDRPDLGGREWGALEEGRLVRNMFDAVDSIALIWTLTTGQADRFDDSTAVLYRTYTVTTEVNQADTTAAEVFSGDMILHLERNALDLWWIVHWEDQHLGIDWLAWSDLKSRYL